MIVEYTLENEEIKSIIENWLCSAHKVSKENIVSVMPKIKHPGVSFIVTVDTNKRYPEGKD